jgi:cell volume regulation protein A
MPRIPVPGLLLLVAAFIPGAPLGPHAVEWIATAMLVVILLDGGIDIGWERMRASLRPVVALGVLGTFLTAGGLALAAHALLGYPWKLAGVIGAALAPTDPAVVFSVLGGTEIRGRAGTILEGEAGVNDPAGIALMLGMIDLATHRDATLLNVASDFGLQMGIGLAFGALGAWVIRTHRELAILLAGAALYAVTALAHGSGFLAVFIAGLAIGDRGAPRELNRRLAAGAEVVVFVALGLTIRTSHLPVGDALLLAAALALLIRPLTVLVALATARLQPGDRAFIAWSGLKGAVPILLAAFAVIHHVARAGEIYGVVFVAVLASVLAQGSLVPTVARRVLRT